MGEKTKTKILLVDDEECVRDFCTEVLGNAGYEVVSAKNGIEALEDLNKDHFNIIITDIMMPGLDGMRFYNLVIKNTPSLKDRFVFITGVPTKEVADFFLTTKAKHLFKPFLISELLKQIDTLKK
ncbi:MAG: response regulator [Deltaproteobacteria bacterium]|nr:response regulator [Deltaproteobacteria bacterium]